MPKLKCQNCDLQAENLFKQDAIHFHKNLTKIAEGNILVCKYCEEQFKKNEEIRKNIVGSNSRHNLVIGGPGTGKTFLFKNIIENLPENSKILVITYINNLVDDLKRQLDAITDRKIEVQTLHSYCKGFLLRNIHPYIYFPDLPKIVEKDASLLATEFNKERLNHEIANLERTGDNLHFYLSRAEYYDAASHNDSVYRVYLFLKENSASIPNYSRIIIDEYQDFNPLEAGVIGLLSRDNASIISGDDDQALYRFKSASPEFIRDLYKDPRYDHHFLIYCRRCTMVLVKAANALIDYASKNKLLENRILKNYQCYWPDKFQDSRAYPKIVVSKCTTNKVSAKFIVKKILEIVKNENIQPSDKTEAEFIITAPSKIPSYLKEVNKILSDKNILDPNIYEIEYKKESDKLSIDDGYELIKQDDKSNLGWRIVLYFDHIDPDEEIKIIQGTQTGKALIELLPKDYISKHKESAESFISKDKIKSESESKKIKVKLTTYLGAKGLSANHVFILGLESKVFSSNPLSLKLDDICQFIVLLTRAKKSLSIVMSKIYDPRMHKSVNALPALFSMIPIGYFAFGDKIKASDL